MSLLNTLQYKQCLCILTLPKRNEKFIDQICIIYRKRKLKRVASCWKGNFCQCKNQKYIQI